MTTGFNRGDLLTLGVQVGTAVSATGRYPWSLRVQGSGGVFDTTISGSAYIRVEDASEFGAGGTLSNLNKLVSFSADPSRRREAESENVGWTDNIVELPFAAGQGKNDFFARAARLYCHERTVRKLNQEISLAYWKLDRNKPSDRPPEKGLTPIRSLTNHSLVYPPYAL